LAKEMVKLTVFQSEGRSCGFELWGHAGHGDKGYDLVCAAISSITQTAILGVTEVVGIKAGFSLEDGDACLTLPKDMTDREAENAALLIDTMQKGLESIELSYPGTLKFHHREV